ncbi:unnamed protein product, partial [Adineta steineri]
AAAAAAAAAASHHSHHHHKKARKEKKKRKHEKSNSSNTVAVSDSDGEEKKKSSSSATATATTTTPTTPPPSAPPTSQPVLVDAPESDEGETKDSDGGTPSTTAPPIPVTESTTKSKAKKSIYTRPQIPDNKVGCGKCGYVGHLTYQCRNFLQANPTKAVVLDVSSTSSPSSDDDTDTPLQQLAREEINREKQKKEPKTSAKSEKQEKPKRKRHRSPSTNSSSESESESKSSKRKRHHKHRHHSHSSCTVFFVIVFLLFSLSHSIRIPLTGDNWFITDNRSYSAQGQIPGTIHTILLAANQITEPYWDFNDINQRSLVYSSWIFTKNFSLTADFLTSTQFILHFDQIDTVANITLNQCFLGQTNSMFIPYTFNVIRSCLQFNNQLRIDFQSPVLYALNQAKAYNDSVPPDCTPDVQHGECHVQFIRKEPCSFSWDWGPAFAPIGIPGDLFLEAKAYNDSVPPDCTPDVQHGECHVQFIRKEPCSFSWDWGPAFAPIGIPGDLFLEGTNHTDMFIQLESINVASYQSSVNKWQVDVLLSSNNDLFDCQFKFILENTSFIYETSIRFDHNLSISLLIPDQDIQLWWPNGYGEQRLYKLSIYNQEQFIGSRTIGFRTVELIQHDYGSTINGTSFYFLINYQPIFIKGSNWIPADAFQERVTDEQLERLLRSAQLANMNMLRIWGGGIYERNSFYEIADRLGIMLWHDFMFACSLYPIDDLFLKNVHDEVIYQVKRLQSHASIVLWAGNNENEAAVAQNWYDVSEEQMPKVKDDYRKLYVDIIMNSVKEVDKGNNRPFVTSSPSNGLETIKENYIAKDPGDPLYGDVHFYGYQNDSWDPTTYPITRFLSETGIQSLPSLDTWYQATNDTSNLNMNSSFVLHREHSQNQITAMIYHIQSNLPIPITDDSLKNFTHWIYLSQINQAMTLKSISDVCRVHSSVNMINPNTSQGHTMGLMYWQINDIWQAPTWSSIEYSLKWKMAHYYVKHIWDWGPAFAPIGIPGDLFLEGTNHTDIFIQLESVNVASYQSSVNKWQVDVLLSSNNDLFDCQLKFILENTSFIYDTSIRFDHNLSISLLIPDQDIQLWWPNGYGDQKLYKLSIYNQEEFIGSRTIGFRTVELIQHDYGSTINGTSFYFLVNYQSIFIKGSNWIPADAFQERVTDEQLERLLRSAQLANMNMLRIWGGGIYERNSFYEIADRLGIMLWHDFMFACSLYPIDDLFLKNVHDEVIYQVKRLQSHTSIVLWAGNNENEAAVAQNWYDVSEEKMPKVKDDYRKLYVDIIMNSVKEVDKGNNRPFVTSSPSNGLETIKENYIAKDPGDPLYGDVHFYGYQNDSWDPTTYPITRFLSETGIQSLPSLDTWYQATNDTSNLNMNSSFLLHREHSQNQITAMIYHIQSNLPVPITNDSLKNFTQWIYLSQINQAMTLKSISDVCRVHSSVNMINPNTSQGHTMGLMYWQINDIWQAPTWSSIEYSLKWKMAHYYVKHMYESVYPIVILTPYLANLTDENARISFYVINDLLNETHGQLMCSIHTLNKFSVQLSIAYDVVLDLTSMQHVANLSYTSLMKRTSCSNDDNCILHCSFDYNHNHYIDQTLFLTQPKNYQLYQPNLHIENIQQITSTDIVIRITATRPALFVWLDISANRSGYFSKNGFHMFEPMITVTFHSWIPITDFDRANFDLRISSLFDVTQP